MILERIYYFANSSILFLMVFFTIYVSLSTFVFPISYYGDSEVTCDEPLMTITFLSVLSWFLSFNFPNIQPVLSFYNIVFLFLSMWFLVKSDQCEIQITDLAIVNIVCQILLWIIFLILLIMTCFTFREIRGYHNRYNQIVSFHRRINLNPVNIQEYTTDNENNYSDI